MTEQIPLADRDCVPPRQRIPPMDSTTYEPLLEQLDGWTVENGQCLYRKFEFPDFLNALAFANAVGGMAEACQHHPDITIAWGKAEIRLWTHSIGGLSEADFVLSARIERWYQANASTA